MKHQENIFRPLALALIASAFFIPYGFIGRAFLIAGAAFLLVFFKKLVAELNQKSFLSNLLVFAGIVLLVTAASYLISVIKSS